MKKLLLLALICFTTNVNAQIKIDKAGDGWSDMVQQALDTISFYDPLTYETLIELCDHIMVWNGPISTNEWDSVRQKGTIIISAADFKLKSVNNIAAVIVHESSHLDYRMFGTKVDPATEELDCYLDEFAFLRLLPYIEPWLMQHTLQMVVNFAQTEYKTKQK